MGEFTETSPKEFASLTTSCLATELEPEPVQTPILASHRANVEGGSKIHSPTISRTELRMEPLSSFSVLNATSTICQTATSGVATSGMNSEGMKDNLKQEVTDTLTLKQIKLRPTMTDTLTL